MSRRYLLLATIVLISACSAKPAIPANAAFSVPYQDLIVGGEKVLLFEYESEEATEHDLNRLSDDARQMDGKNLPWKTGPVHIFAAGKQIAVYLGDTPEVLRLLETEGGEQVVGDAY